ncbi:MAG: hypothetical protein A2Y53_00110 [Chloroflexi bacterium RBG_16_47_49]|nr:MAG: hypothetical protein A2Y53_00110 [Chloroflexi bacterium RBG_16_47_49]
MSGLFDAGKIVFTPGAAELLSQPGSKFTQLLAWHLIGIWGELDDDDKAANDLAVKDGSRILSAYMVQGKKLWIITEAVGEDGTRLATTFLLPEEY